MTTVRKKQIGNCDGRKSSTIGTYVGIYADARRPSSLVYACTRAHCTRREMHFLSPVFIRVRRLRDPLSSLGITGTSAHLSSTHVRNPSRWSSSSFHCHRPFTVLYAPARARHTRCNLRGNSVLPMSPVSSSFVPSFSRVITRVEMYNIYAARGDWYLHAMRNCVRVRY